jgi:predicted GNAT family acetyltransferase
MTVVDNSAAGRFELVEQGHMAWASYRREGGALFIDYVFSPEALRGQGTAGRLMQGIVDDASTAGLQIVPICGYAASWSRRNT